MERNFTEFSAWNLIADELEAGCDVRVIELEKPPGNLGYVLEIELEATEPPLYVKLELGSGIIFGRSFHYSDVTNKQGFKHDNN